MKEAWQSQLDRLAEALEVAFRQAVLKAQRDHAGERFYAYILYTHPLLAYAFLSCNTEEALAAIASTEKEREKLRWSPPDWNYHCEGKEFFAPANEILSIVSESQGYEDPAREARREVFLTVLKQLDADEVFARASDRESVLVNIMCGDQDVVAQVESARELNPLPSYLRYARHQLHHLKAREKEIKRSSSMYKEKSLARIRPIIAQVEKDLAGEHPTQGRRP